MRATEIAVVVEDDLSFDVVERIVRSSGPAVHISRRLIARGGDKIRLSMAKYRSASAVLPHVVLTDLDRLDCPVALRRAWGAEALPRTLLFRVAVREVEGWLLGDAKGFAEFAGIARIKLPARPEDLDDPKQTLINLVRRSRSRRLAEELVPAQGSRASIGPRYNERLGKFAREQWNLQEAAAACPSLRRMCDRLDSFLSQEF